jgi:hypothetical protein
VIGGDYYANVRTVLVDATAGGCDSTALRKDADVEREMLHAIQSVLQTSEPR